jgi:serine/threonine protein kinase
LDAEVNREEMFIAMVMEVGEIDLAKVLQKQMHSQTQPQQQKKPYADGSNSDYTQLSPFFVRMVWQDMLEAVDYIHANRVVHGDLKPANFVFVKGHLKLIDFGIAKAFGNDTTNIYRESQIGTINYMAPEYRCQLPTLRTNLSTLIRER